MQVSIAERVLGTAHPEDVDGSISQAWQTLTGESAEAEELIDEGMSLTRELMAAAEIRPNTPNYGLPIEVIEGQSTLSNVVGYFEYRRVPFATILSNWPLYQDLYTRHVARAEPEGAMDKPRRSLLLGALSAVSTAAFAALSEDVLHAEPTVLDVQGGAAKKRHGTFVEGNALAMPGTIPAESMRFVLTNNLLSMLVDTSGRLVRTEAAEKETINALARQIFGVLESGGHLLMYEVPQRFDSGDRDCKTDHNKARVRALEDNVRSALGAAGFTGVAIEQAWQIPGVEYLFDPTRQFDEYEHKPVVRARMIYARKP